MTFSSCFATLMQRQPFHYLTSAATRIELQDHHWEDAVDFGDGTRNNQGTTIEQEARWGELIEQNLMNTERE